MNEKHKLGHGWRTLLTSKVKHNLWKRIFGTCTAWLTWTKGQTNSLTLCSIAKIIFTKQSKLFYLIFLSTKIIHNFMVNQLKPSKFYLKAIEMFETEDITSEAHKYFYFSWAVYFEDRLHVYDIFLLKYNNSFWLFQMQKLTHVMYDKSEINK